jgi:hypothetical protein
VRLHIAYKLHPKLFYSVEIQDFFTKWVDQIIESIQDQISNHPVQVTPSPFPIWSKFEYVYFPVHNIGGGIWGVSISAKAASSSTRLSPYSIHNPWSIWVRNYYSSERLSQPQSFFTFSTVERQHRKGLSSGSPKKVLLPEPRDFLLAPMCLYNVVNTLPEGLADLSFILQMIPLVWRVGGLRLCPRFDKNIRNDIPTHIWLTTRIVSLKTEKKLAVSMSEYMTLRIPSFPMSRIVYTPMIGATAVTALLVIARAGPWVLSVSIFWLPSAILGSL